MFFLGVIGGSPLLTLDDFHLRAAADADPEAVLARAPAPVLDEVPRFILDPPAAA